MPVLKASVFTQNSLKTVEAPVWSLFMISWVTVSGSKLTGESCSDVGWKRLPVSISDNPIIIAMPGPARVGYCTLSDKRCRCINLTGVKYKFLILGFSLRV
jgi:hypothetical protein